MMKEPVFKTQHWWLVAAAILFGVALFFYLRVRAY
jgi:NADH:ubiquinone oxidoreductase subunit 2 (subunit N)